MGTLTFPLKLCLQETPSDCCTESSVSAPPQGCAGHSSLFQISLLSPYEDLLINSSHRLRCLLYSAQSWGHSLGWTCPAYPISPGFPPYAMTEERQPLCQKTLTGTRGAMLLDFPASLTVRRTFPFFQWHKGYYSPALAVCLN